jgi:hypothetical protein
MKFTKVISMLICFVFGFLILAGCNTTDYKQEFIDKAQEVLKQHHLTGDVQMKFDKSSEGIELYLLNVTSDDYEIMSDYEKGMVLSELGKISITDSKIAIMPYVFAKGNEYVVLDDQVWKNDAPLTSNPTPTSAPVDTTNNNSNVVGRWYDTNDSLCHDKVITKSGDTFSLTTTCKDGSGITKTLTIKTIAGEDRLYEDPNNAFGDYMVVESDGSLAFYDDQGLIYEVSPS